MLLSVSIGVVLILQLLVGVSSHGDHGGGEHASHQHGSHGRDHVLSHLSEELGEAAATLSDEEELHFHWFRQHDYDNSQSLDGLELVHAISHFSEHGIQDEDALIKVIDDILKSDDKNRDGFLDYYEFTQSENPFF